MLDARNDDDDDGDVPKARKVGRKPAWRIREHFSARPATVDVAFVATAAAVIPAMVAVMMATTAVFLPPAMEGQQRLRRHSCSQPTDLQVSSKEGTLEEYCGPI